MGSGSWVNSYDSIACSNAFSSSPEAVYAVMSVPTGGLKTIESYHDRLLWHDGVVQDMPLGVLVPLEGRHDVHCGRVLTAQCNRRVQSV